MKKINKKYILPVILSLLVIGMGAAALVGYISNKVEADITVSSPMLTGISLGDESWAGASYPETTHDLADWELTGTPLLISVYGGETLILYTMSQNLADAEIAGFEEAIVTNLDGVTCEDFASVKVKVDSIYGNLGYGTEQELIGTGGCQVIDDYHIQFGSPDNSLWGIGETDVSKITVTFKTDAEGTYTFTYEVIPTK